MATLNDLMAQGVLQRFEPDLPPERLCYRQFYISQAFVRWADQILPDLIPRWDTELEPIQQVQDLLGKFICGERLAWINEYHPMRPEERGVWEMKTADVRIYGWFYRRDVFIAHQGCDATRAKGNDGFSSLHGSLRAETERFRSTLDLDPPLFIEGSDPDDVFSPEN